MKKLIWPILGLIVMAVLTTIQQVNADNVITASEWGGGALQALMAFNVWATANLPQYASMKSYVAAAIAMVSLLVSLITGGLTTNEIVNLIITGLAALGVIFTPQPITTVINGTTVPANGEVRGTNRQLG